MSRHHPFEKVLVATDLSELALAAMRAALGLVVRVGGSASNLTVLHVRHAARRLSEVEGPFAEHVERAFGRHAAHVGRLVRSGDPAETIVEAATRLEADLVVTGTHGRTGLRRLILGSVAEEVVRCAPCPVLTIGRHPLALELELPEDTGSLFPIRRILAPTDGSACSRVGEDLAAILATITTAEVHLVHAVEEGWADTMDASMLEAKRVVDLAERAFRERHREGGAFSLVEHARTGDPAEEIARCATELRADLVVMATHGRTGVRERAVGGHTDHVMRLAPCPVLAVREKGVLIASEKTDDGDE